MKRMSCEFQVWPGAGDGGGGIHSSHFIGGGFNLFRRQSSVRQHRGLWRKSCLPLPRVDEDTSQSGGEDGAQRTTGPGRGITWTLESWTRQSCSWILWSSSCCHRMLACRILVLCSSWSLMVWNMLSCAENLKAGSKHRTR